MRHLSGRSVLLILLSGWGCAIGLVMLEAAKLLPDASWIVALFACFIACPALLAVIWAFERSTIGNWHGGKIVLLWLLAGVVVRGLVSADLRSWIRWLCIPCIVVPIVVITWSWLSGREKLVSPAA